MNMNWNAGVTSLDYVVLNDRMTANNEQDKMWEVLEFEFVCEFAWMDHEKIRITDPLGFVIKAINV
jgi:hypothetical protein